MSNGIIGHIDSITVCHTGWKKNTIGTDEWKMGNENKIRRKANQRKDIVVLLFVWFEITKKNQIKKNMFNYFL